MKQLILSFVAIFLSLSIFAKIEDYDKTGCTLGRWTYDLDAARKVAKEYNSVILVEFMKNDGGCGVCNSVAISLSETERLKNWSKEYKIPLVIADYASSSYASQQVDCSQYESFPIFIVLDGSDGKTRLEWFYVSNVQTGNGTAAVKPKPSNGYMITAIKDDFYEVVERLLAVQNNSPYNKAATGANRHRNATAQLIEPDVKGLATESLHENTIFDLGWTNSLMATHWLNGSTIWAFYEDQFDWFKFVNKTDGASYQIKTPVLNDPLDVGMVCVFTNQETAVAANTYIAATNGCFWSSKLSDLKDDGTFALPSGLPQNQEIYVLFTRRDVTRTYNAKKQLTDIEDITLDYTFTLQEVNQTSCWVEKQLYQAMEDVGTTKITVKRSSNVGTSSVKFSIQDCDQETLTTLKAMKATEGVDFSVKNANYTVSFVDGKDTAEIEISVARGDEYVETKPRAFSIALQNDNESETGFEQTVVEILDVDGEEETGDVVLNATTTLQSVGGKLNGDDFADVYCLTNLPATQGSVYLLLVNPIDIRDFADGQIKVEVKRASLAETICDATVDKDGMARLFFGTETADGMASATIPDLMVTVSRKQAASGEFPTVRYQLAYRRYDRPIVTVSTPDAAYETSLEDRDFSVAISADGLDEIRQSLTDLGANPDLFKPTIAWKVENPATGAPAAAGTDYVAEAGSIGMDKELKDVVDVKLPAQTKFSYPDRSFRIVLEAADNQKLFKLGSKTEYVCTLKADTYGNAKGGKDDPLVLKAPESGETDWVTTGETARDLSHVCTNDWIRFDNIQSSTPDVRHYYRLQAEDLFFKPAEYSASNIVVTIWTNDVATDYKYTLADLAKDDEAATPLLWFDALEGDSVFVLVSRPDKADVYAKYKLALRAWEKPVFAFDVAAVTNDDTEASFDIGISRSGNVDDEVTVAIQPTDLAAGCVDGYYSVPSNITFKAGVSEATITVTVTDPEWNGRNWTGDRLFRLNLAEVYPVGAFDFDVQSNAVTVVLAETNGEPLDEYDPVDDVFENVATNSTLALDIPGNHSPIVRTGMLNARADALSGTTYNVNDTNDWIRFTGIDKDETYCFKFDSFEAENADITVRFESGTNGVLLAELSGAELLKDGYRYTASANLDVLVLVSRTSSENRPASVNYELSVYNYDWPVVGFDVPAGQIVVTNDDLEGGVEIPLRKVGNTTETNVTAKLLKRNGAVWATALFKDEIVPEEVSFPAVADVSTNVLLMTAGFKDDRWTGDWSCNVYLDLETNVARYGKVTNVTVTVVDAIPQLDVTDPVDDAESGASALDLSDGGIVVTNHLNGIDVPHEGQTMYSDQSDWYRITSTDSACSYRISIPDFLAYENDGLTFSVEIKTSLMETNIPFARLLAGRYFDIPMPVAEDILVRVSRSASLLDVPVSVRYALNVQKVEWSLFSVAVDKSEVCNDDADGVLVTVSRPTEDVTEQTVLLTVTDTNAVKVVDCPLGVLPLVFASNVTAIVTNVHPVANARDGFWKRGGDFTVSISKDAASPYVNLSGATQEVVSVTDASRMPSDGDDYPADNVADGAQQYEFSLKANQATNHVWDGQALWEGQPAVCLNGDDTEDWYLFTNVDVGSRYRLTVDGIDGLNTNGLDFVVTVYVGNRKTGVGSDQFDVGQVLVSTNLLEISRLDVTAQEGTDVLFVKVSRSADASRDVAFRYVLGYRKISDCRLTFVAAGQEVSERADSFYVDVDCVMLESMGLESDVSAIVTPSVESIPEGSAATPVEDFDVRSQSVTWSVGSTGGIQRVRIPLGNFDNNWKGDRYFKLVLTSEGEVKPDGVTEMTIKLLEKDSPVYGTIQPTAVNGLTVTKNTLINCREGDLLSADVKLAGGISSTVTGVWIFAVGTVKKDVVQELFVFGEGPQLRTFDIPVPEFPSVQIEQSATVTFALKAPAKTVTLAKGAVTSFKLTLKNKNYAGSVADVGAADRSQCAFRASNLAWYLDQDGSYRSSTPAAGGSVAMTTTVTGAGTLSFEATIPQSCELQVVCDGKTTLANAGQNAVSIGVGTKTITFRFVRSKSGAADVAAQVSNVEFTPAPDFNRIGTYVGSAAHDEFAGRATLTVGQNGRFSGKFQCADGTWTFSATGGWEANGTKSVKAICRSESENVTLTIDANGKVEAAGTSLKASLRRNVWKDKPLTKENAALLEKALGYYTTTLPVREGDCGSGYLTGTVSSDGAIKFAGVFADGRSASISSVLGDDGVFILYSASSASVGGWFAADVAVDVSGEIAVLATDEDGLWYDSLGETNRQVRVVGGFYDKVSNLHEFYAQSLNVSALKSFDSFTYQGDEYDALRWAPSMAIPVSIAFDEDGKIVVSEHSGERLFTMNFVRATGLFSGAVRAVFDVNGREIKKSYNYRGVLTPNRADSDADDAEGRGFFLQNGKSYDLSIQK